ncbi:MAG: CHAT domain-containing protein [Acidobacteria bacterium]|nr:CHAT domain-containing protein [Acidobacteriota bacterium]
MSIDSYRRDVQRHQEEISRLQTEKSREVAKAAEEHKRANSAAELASRATSTSSMQSRLREAQRHRETAVRHQQRVADIESKIAREQGRLNDAQRRLVAAQDQESRRQVQEQERLAREQDRRMRAISGKLIHHDQLHQVALWAIKKLQQLPERIVVLFLAANPLDQQQLRLDEEVRAIGEMIRKAEHRDAIRLESRWAVRPLDVLQAINECQPRIVHFSGHGSNRDEIVFQDNSGQAKLVSKEAIVQTMAAASGDIQLVFFNTCYSHAQAEGVVQHVAAAIGMNTSIGDDAARVFAAQFYSAIGFGRSVGQSFKQARAALMLEGIPEESTPELFVTTGLDADDLVLVRPANGDHG